MLGTVVRRNHRTMLSVDSQVNGNHFCRFLLTHPSTTVAGAATSQGRRPCL
jgi:hypothetical protein